MNDAASPRSVREALMLVLAKCCKAAKCTNGQAQKLEASAL